MDFLNQLLPDYHQIAELSFYIQREVLTGIFNSSLTKTQATVELDAWVTRVQALGLTCFDSFIGTLQK